MSSTTPTAQRSTAINLASWRARGRFHATDGIRQFYVDEGRGPGLVLLHGFPTFSYDWVYLWPALTARFRVIAADFAGYGFSDKPRRHSYSVADHADRITQLLRHVGLNGAHVYVLAHDYGSTVAQELLARHVEGTGQRLAAIAFLNGGLFPEVHRPRLIQKLLLGPAGSLVARLVNERAFRRSFSAVFGPNSQPTEEELRAAFAGMKYGEGLRIYHKLIRYITERRVHRARWVGPLTTPPVPLRFINGLLDPVSGQHMVRRYRELVPGADVVELPDAGHYPQLEAPGRVLTAFLDFVSTK